MKINPTYRSATNDERLAHKYDGAFPEAITTPSGRLEVPVMPDDFPKSMDEAEARNYAIGQSWFRADSMRWFGTRILGSIHAGGYFVTSDWSGFDHAGRAYTVRRALPDGSIDTVTPDGADEGETGFNYYPTARAAHAAAKKAAAAYTAEAEA
jgi:hypothetical protein